MILTRLGNKRRISDKIIPHFPEHEGYIEPFFGAGGMFFSKQRVKYNIVNDLDSDVFNLFEVLKDRSTEFYKALELTPYHDDLFNKWKVKEERDPIWKAVRFIFLSNYTFLGAKTSLRTTLFENTKANTLKRVGLISNELMNVNFQNKDFRKFLSSLYFSSTEDPNRTLVYADPPYLSTGSTYDKFTEKDVVDLLDCLEDTKCKFAYSEFDNDFILNQAKERGLNVIDIGERNNLKNKRKEVLITNYSSNESITLF